MLSRVSNPQIIHKKILTHSLTPLSAFEKLHAKMLLESASLVSGKGRYSLLILTKAFSVVKNANDYLLIDDSKTVHHLNSVDANKDYLQWLAYFKDFAPSVDDFDFPLPLGGIGYLGFEFFAEIEHISLNTQKYVAHYDCAFVFAREILVFDHLYDSAYLFCLNYANEHFIPTQSRIHELIQTLEKDVMPPTPKHDYPSKIIEHDIPFKDYVSVIKDEIYKGNVMQCVLSRSVEIHTELPPLDAYKNLRHENPSPYMFFCDFDDFVLFGASPEIMIKLDGEKLTLRPIAGSCKRGKNMQEDEWNEKRLLDDPKENAEHLMLVDLGRNDLGKISKPASIKVHQFKSIERTARVTHIASEVCGILAPNKDIRDVIFATFPAGTISGAPKIAAIHLIAHLETHARGFYSGCVGYIDSKNNFNSCISIRTSLYKDGVYYLQAGAGIVFDSNPDDEYQETQNKMKSLVYAITQNVYDESEYS